MTTCMHLDNTLLIMIIMLQSHFKNTLLPYFFRLVSDPFPKGDLFTNVILILLAKHIQRNRITTNTNRYHSIYIPSFFAPRIGEHSIKQLVSLSHNICFAMRSQYSFHLTHKFRIELSYTIISYHVAFCICLLTF